MACRCAPSAVFGRAFGASGGILVKAMAPSVPAYCLHCLRPVTLTYEVQPDPPENKWTCPHPDCQGENAVYRMRVTRAEPRVISAEREAQDKKSVH